MYNFNQICELFDEDEGTIQQALSLYFQKYGGDSTPPYTDEVVGKLDEFFSLVDKSGGKLLAANGSSGEIGQSEQQTQQIENVLGVKGVALAVAISAAREGRSLARLHENVARAAFNAESNRVSAELLDKLDTDAGWLEGYCEDSKSQSNLLKKLNIVQEETRFNEILEMAIAKTQSKSNRPTRPVQPQWGQYL